MYKRIITLSCYILLLCVTVSSAWILKPQYNHGTFVEMDYSDSSKNTLTMVSDQLRMWVYLPDEMGEMRLIGRSEDKGNGGTWKLPRDRIIPNGSIPFRIRFYNTSGTVLRVRISLSGLECDRALMKDDIIFVSALGGSTFAEYTGQVRQPDMVYKSVLKSGTLVGTDEVRNRVTYDLVLLDGVEIPPMPENKYVELDGYFYFDKDRMDNDCQSKYLFLRSFRAVQQ